MLPELAEHIWATLGQINLPSLILGLVSLVILLVMKKIMPKDTGNTPKKMDVYILFSKYFINIRTRTAQLRCKPSDCTSLIVTRTFNKLPRMNHAIFIDTHPRERISIQPFFVCLHSDSV